MKKIAILGLLFFILVNFILKVNSKFLTSINLYKEIKIAKPIFIFEKGEVVSITNDDIESLVKEYTFTVKNYEENQISENNFNYTIEVEDKIKENIVSYKLYKVIDEKEQIISFENKKTDKIKISANEKYEQKYRMYLYLENIDNEEINENIYIKVIAEQIL